MICERCGSNNSEDAVFCRYCGRKISDNSASSAESGSLTKESTVDPKPVFGDNEKKTGIDSGYKDLIDPKEKVLCILGNGYLSNFITSGVLGKGFAILTDKRVYFNGRSYISDHRRKLNRATCNSVTGLKDVTGFEINNSANIGAKICAIVMTILFLLITFAGSRTRYRQNSLEIRQLMLCLRVSIIFIIMLSYILPSINKRSEISHVFKTISLSGTLIGTGALLYSFMYFNLRDNFNKTLLLLRIIMALVAILALIIFAMLKKQDSEMIFAFCGITSAIMIILSFLFKDKTVLFMRGTLLIQAVIFGAVCKTIKSNNADGFKNRAAVICRNAAITVFVYSILDLTEINRFLLELDEVTSFIQIITLTVAIISAFIYIVNRKNMVAINYSGGSIGFDLNWYSISEVMKFRKELFKAKEALEKCTAETK